MQNNALAKIFGILFAIVSIYQLSFTFITSQQEENAADFAAKKVLDNTEDYLEKRELTAINYLDSIGNNSLSLIIKFMYGTPIGLSLIHI